MTIPTKLIQLTDGTLVEVAVDTNHAREISGGFAEKVNASLENIQLLLARIARPVVAAWSEVGKDVAVESGEIEFGFSFETEGNLYIAKAKSEASVVVKFTLKTQR